MVSEVTLIQYSKMDIEREREGEREREREGKRERGTKPAPCDQKFFFFLGIFALTELGIYRVRYFSLDQAMLL